MLNCRACFRLPIRGTVTGCRIPSIRATFNSLFIKYPPSAHPVQPPADLFQLLLSDPFVVAPISFCIAVLSVVGIVPRSVWTFINIYQALIHLDLPSSQHRAFDLAIAAVETVVTFRVSYRACVVLGTVLLQTSPPRGFSGGRTEAFLRAMKEVGVVHSHRFTALKTCT